MAAPLFLRGNILTPAGIQADHLVEVSAGRIVKIFPARGRVSSDQALNYGGGLIVPGFIDLHVNPVGDCDLANSAADAVDRLASRLARGGCTGFLAALITCDFKTLYRQLGRAKTWMGKRTQGARLLGVHLEGPFLNPLRRGVHPGKHITNPTSTKVSALLNAAGDSLKMMTVAPEVPGGMDLVRRLAKERVVASIGHSDATYDQARESFEAGIRSATHLFNASSPYHHRAPGVAGAVLAIPQIVAQVIPDGWHVHPSCLEMVYRVKGKRHFAAVTDSLVAPQPGFVFAGRKITKKGKRFLAADATLAGSDLAMAQGLVNLQSFVKAPARDLIECLTLTPARLLGIDRFKGSIETGKDADLVWLDEKGAVKATWVEGEQVYVRDHRLRR